MDLKFQDSRYSAIFYSAEKEPIKEACLASIADIARHDNRHSHVLPFLGGVAIEFKNFGSRQLSLSIEDLFNLEAALERYCDPAISSQAIILLGQDPTSRDTGLIEKRALLAGRAADVLKDLREKKLGLEQNNSEIAVGFARLQKKARSGQNPDSLRVVFGRSLDNDAPT